MSSKGEIVWNKYLSRRSIFIIILGDDEGFLSSHIKKSLQKGRDCLHKSFSSFMLIKWGEHSAKQTTRDFCGLEIFQCGARLRSEVCENHDINLKKIALMFNAKRISQLSYKWNLCLSEAENILCAFKYAKYEITKFQFNCFKRFGRRFKFNPHQIEHLWHVRTFELIAFLNSLCAFRADFAMALKFKLFSFDRILG